jgi:methionine sulfoxide reductase heme-binding subunit
MVIAHLPIAWIVARAAGMVALVLLTFSTWLGLAMSTRILGTLHLKRLLGWHRTLVWTALSMLVLHAGAPLFDPVLRFGLPSVLVPFASPWHAGAVAMGVVAGWFSLMLALSFRARRWIGQRGWRLLHYTSFAAFGLALMHALYAGTDFAGVKGSIIAAVALAPVLWLGFLRILEPSRSPTRSATRPSTHAPTRQPA